MATKWTREQQRAIEARNHTILVSAAAGSGKTAVLVERIVTLLKEGNRLNRMLIVTFTRAAAAEMRQRLNERLLKEAAADPEIMGRALDDLESAEISTIHSFCQKVLKNNFQAVGIDPLSRIAEEKQTDVLFEQAFKDAMNEKLEDEADADFQAFAEAFTQRDIQDMTLRLHKFLMSMHRPFDWLDQHIDQMTVRPWREHPWYQEDQARMLLSGIELKLKIQQRMFSETNAVSALMDTWNKDYQAYREIRDAGKHFGKMIASYDMVRAAICRGLSPEQKEWQKQYKAVRDEIKQNYKLIQELLRVDEEKLYREFGQIQQHMKGFASLMKRLHQRYGEYKQQLSYLDFNDLEQMTMAVLEQEEYREAMQAEYDHIFVDECQDVSAIQDAILQSIHGEHNCMFMVGDVKQSIYRFRNAEPTLFLHRMLTYSDDEYAREHRILLQKNFRSRPNVLEATNMVFRTLMRRDVTELDYTASEELIPGRVTENDPPVELHLIPSGKIDKQTEIAMEAQVIAERIRQLLTERFDDKGVMRHYQYKDIVILLPKVAGEGSAMAQLLEEQGVPVYFDGAESYFNLAEVQAMTALLQVLDNPRQDVALMATLKMTPFHMSDGDLAEIRLCKTGRDVPFHEAFYACCEGDSPLAERCRVSRETLAAWRFRADTMHLPDFLWYLVRETGYYASCGALPEGELRQANLRMLCQRAAEYESSGEFTLSGFLQQIEQQRQSGDDRAAKTLGENENLVRIMTIHKSKGLEFPAVFCARLSNKLHLTQRSGLMMHSQLGVCLPYVNRSMNIRRETMADKAFQYSKKLNEKAERARLLYVGMTRAREQLILVGHVPEELSSSVWNEGGSAYGVWDADSMMDWIMQAISTFDHTQLSTTLQQPPTPWKIRVWRNIDPQVVEKEKVIHSMEEWLNTSLSAESGDKLGKVWQGIYNEQLRQPLKTSVTSLAKKNVLGDPLPLTDADEDEESKRQPETIVMPLRLSELPSKPAFMEEKQLTGAERGTLIHHALSLLDLEQLKNVPDLETAIREQIEDMTQRGCFTIEEAFLLDVEKMGWYLRSHIGKRMMRSDNVRQEWGFNYRMDEQGTLLQGVIDCAFEEDGCWVVVDYKTDHIVDEEAFIQRYTMQLNWYARALEAITGKKVSEMWLYALSRGKAYPVERT